MTVRVRFAPSPTGYLHIGGARSALFTWLFAKHHGGKFILRIEDTDTTRTQEGAVLNIMESLRWLGLEWDEGPDIGGQYGPYVQTERRDLYSKWAHYLVDHGLAYKCFCTAEELAERRDKSVGRSQAGGYDRQCRDMDSSELAAKENSSEPYVIRFKMPASGRTIVPDLIRGDIIVDNSQVGDHVILKSNGLPTYHLAHVVDDHFMEISHVTRGAEWISSAPLHVNLFHALGWELPTFVHMPVILNPGGRGKLSKRTQAFTDSGHKVLVRVKEFRDAGYLPEAVVNFLTNVGWSFGDDREKFTADEAAPRFELAELNPSETRLPYEKLDWLNGQYIQELDAGQLLDGIKPFVEQAGYEFNHDQLRPLAAAMSVRLKRFDEALEQIRFLYAEPEQQIEVERLSHKKMEREAASAALRQARTMLNDLDPFAAEAIAALLSEIGQQATSNGKAGPFLGIMRYIVTRQKVSPPLFESMEASGRETVLRRLDEAIVALTQ